MKKSTKGPTVKKGTVLGHDYFDVQELADPEAHLTEEQKKWPVVDGWGVPPEKAASLPPDPAVAEPKPKMPPAA